MEYTSGTSIDDYVEQVNSRNRHRNTDNSLGLSGP